MAHHNIYRQLRTGNLGSRTRAAITLMVVNQNWLLCCSCTQHTHPHQTSCETAKCISATRACLTAASSRPHFRFCRKTPYFWGENASQSAICFIYYVAALRHKCCDKNKQQQQGTRTDRLWLIYTQTSISRLITRLVPRKELLVHSLLGAAQSFEWARALSCF